MLTYDLTQAHGAIYYYLYECIRADIENETIKADEKLPSKRSLAEHLNISVITVQNAYAQLYGEGYIYSIERSGYFASVIEGKNRTIKKPALTVKEDMPNNIYQKTIIDAEKHFKVDFCSNSIAKANFPVSVWSRQLREVLSEGKEAILSKSSSKGSAELRDAIAGLLYSLRGMRVSAEQIIVGAGTEYLYGHIIKLLGTDKIYGLEDPGYRKIASVYNAEHATCCFIPLDKDGLSVHALLNTKTDILHISPNHHFPTGIVMPIKRRQELLNWANEKRNRYIIEDDFDSEFRFNGRVIPTLQSIDNDEKVIYMNTFSKTVSPAVRIAYMVLPAHLLQLYEKKLSFYSCTVSGTEQLALAKFIEKGFFESHLNRMRKSYKQKRNILLALIKKEFGEQAEVREENGGLHFILSLKSEFSDADLKQRCMEQGINIEFLSEYCFEFEAEKGNMIINYSGLDNENAAKFVALLASTVYLQFTNCML